jgi:hypothetical protein
MVMAATNASPCHLSTRSRVAFSRGSDALDVQWNIPHPPMNDEGGLIYARRSQPVKSPRHPGPALMRSRSRRAGPVCGVHAAIPWPNVSATVRTGRPHSRRLSTMWRKQRRSTSTAASRLIGRRFATAPTTPYRVFRFPRFWISGQQGSAARSSAAAARQALRRVRSVADI